MVMIIILYSPQEMFESPVGHLLTLPPCNRVRKTEVDALVYAGIYHIARSGKSCQGLQVVA